ncbi:hypothetical protein BJV82DRAFT_580800 [Fennellomyces sp. T-0311]|nr:hypothetical protein BJV82DRAFT_580800 [Fennellomyces sp. T-0311]
MHSQSSYYIPSTWKCSNVSHFVAHSQKWSEKEDSALTLTWTSDESEALTELGDSEVEEWVSSPKETKVEDHKERTDFPLTEASSSDESSTCSEEELDRSKGKAMHPKRRKKYKGHSVRKKSRSVATQTSDTEQPDDVEVLVLELWTPLWLFAMENRDRIATENPTITKHHGINKKISEVYNSLDANEREAYLNPSSEVIDRWYKRRLYQKEKQLRAAGKGYTVFARETYPKIRAAHPNFGVIEINRYLGQQWNALDASTRHDYAQKCNSKISL